MHKSPTRGCSMPSYDAFKNHVHYHVMVMILELSERIKCYINQVKISQIYISLRIKNKQHGSVNIFQHLGSRDIFSLLTHVTLFNKLSNVVCQKHGGQCQ